MGNNILDFCLVFLSLFATFSLWYRRQMRVEKQLLREEEEEEEEK